jgi:ferredoxin
MSIPDVYAIVDVEKCMGCGVCVEHCEQGALELKRDDTKGEPLEIVELIAAFGNDL